MKRDTAKLSGKQQCSHFRCCGAVNIPTQDEPGRRNDRIENYRGKVAVTALGPAYCRVSWSSQFTPVGLSEPEAKARYQNAYAAALLHAKNLLEQST